MATEELKQEVKTEKAENPFKAAARKKQQIQAKTVKEVPDEKPADSASEIGGAEESAAVEAVVSSEAGNDHNAPAEAPEKQVETKEVAVQPEESPDGPEDRGEDGEQGPRSVREEIVASYTASQIKEKKEAKTARIQVMTTPSIKGRLKELEAEGRITNMNHLINYLLRQYLGIEDE